MKKKVFSLSVVAILIAVCSFGTVAYYNAQDVAHNVITTGGVKIEIDEWADDERTIPFADVEGVVPNSSVTKIAEVKNTGKSDAWVRVRVEKKIALSQSGEADSDMLKVNVNKTDWIDGGDGYFYYAEKLSADEITEPIFTSVEFSENMDNDYQGARCSVDVYAQAVQSANNGTDALSASGWPEA